MALKTVEIEGKTYAELADDGKVLYVGEDGTETGYDGEALAAKVNELNGEAATRRREANEAKEKLATFEGIEDPEAAIKALETVKSLDDKKLIDAGEVDQVKAEAISATEQKWQTLISEKYEPLEAERDEYKASLHKEMIGGRFARSKFISEKMVVPVEMVQATFGTHFTIEDGKVKAKYTDGKEVYSKSNPGEVAEFDEALELIVQSSNMADYVLKGTGKKGTGAPGSGTGQPGEKTMTVEQFEELPFAERGKFLSEGGKLQDAA